MYCPWKNERSQQGGSQWQSKAPSEEPEMNIAYRSFQVGISRQYLRVLMLCKIAVCMIASLYGLHR